MLALGVSMSSCGGFTSPMVSQRSFYIWHIYQEVGEVLSNFVAHEIADILKSDAPVESSQMASTFRKLDKTH